MPNPFKDLNHLTRDLENFLNKHRAIIYNNSKRISDYFEMACYNYIVKFYENNGYSVSIKNLIRQKFRYKCSTAGNPDNFSYFEASKKIKKRAYKFEIRHNLNIQSFHQSDIFTTPDISVVKPSSIIENKDFYNSSTKHYYVANKNLVTFFEAKNFNPFPELLFNFIGVVNELRPRLLKPRANLGTENLSLSLLISGRANSHADKIKSSLESRYHINILFDLFTIGNATFSKYSIQRLKKI